MKSRRIACGRTDHFCNFDGIAKTLFCCRRKCPPSSSQAPYRSLRRERQSSFTPLLLLSPQNLRFCRGPEWQSLSAVSGRKRYNALDFAGQNRVPKADLPALLWNPPGYRQHHFRAADRNAFCRYSFSPACCKSQKVILQRRGKMKNSSAPLLKEALLSV